MMVMALNDNDCDQELGFLSFQLVEEENQIEKGNGRTRAIKERRERMKSEMVFVAKERRERLVSEWGFFFNKLYIYIYNQVQVAQAIGPNPTQILFGLIKLNLSPT